LRITDLESRNGTFVNDVPVIDGYVPPGGIARVGATLLRFDPDPAAARATLPIETAFGSVVGKSPEMRRLYPLCARLAASTVPVVMEGETGTGKEALPESIHTQGPLASGPFVVFDCTTVPPNLVESELFGHERGAFTGAVSSRRGVFERAEGGTLL